MVTVVCTVPVHVVHVRTVHGTTCTTYHGTRTFHVSHGCGQRIIGHCAHTHIKHVCMNDECTHVFFNARFSLGPEDPTFGTFQCTPLPNPETSRCWSQCLDTVNNFAFGQVLFALCFPQACISLHRRHGLRLDTGNHSLVAGGLDMNEGGGNMQETGSAFKGHRRRNLLDLGSWSIFSLLEWFCERPRVQ